MNFETAEWFFLPELNSLFKAQDDDFGMKAESYWVKQDY